jgi:flagellar biosynthesis protein FlhF
MQLSLFHGTSMPAVLAQIRAEHGPDALILSTRRTGRTVEVTVGLEPPDDAPPPLAPPFPPPVPLPAPTPPRSRIARCLDWHGVPGVLADVLAGATLEDGLRDTLAFAPLPLGPNASPLLVAGPAGAGKTVCVARLATRLVLSGVRPTVITADGSRAGAIEQIAAFTRLLAIDLVVANPTVLARAVTRRTAAPVLIDAPALDPTASGDRALLVELAEAAAATITLVLPAGLDAGYAAELGESYAECGARLLLASRLDTSRRLGGILAAAHAATLCLTEAGIAPGIADGLVPITPAFLAERLSSGPVRTRQGADT